MRTFREDVVSGTRISLYPFADDNASDLDARMTPSVSVYQNKSFLTGKWEHPQIGWPSLGHQSLEISTTFAYAVLAACDWAKELSKRVEPSKE